MNLDHDLRAEQPAEAWLVQGPALDPITEAVLAQRERGGHLASDPTLPIGLGYAGQRGYRPCTCQMCDASDANGRRRLALRIEPDDNPMPHLRLFRWSRRRARS